MCFVVAGCTPDYKSPTITMNCDVAVIEFLAKDALAVSSEDQCDDSKKYVLYGEKLYELKD